NKNPLRPQPYHSHPILQMLHGLPQWNEATAQEPVRRQQYRCNHRYEEQDPEPVFRPPPDELLGDGYLGVLLLKAIPAEPLHSGQVAAARRTGRHNQPDSIANPQHTQRLPRLKYLRFLSWRSSHPLADQEGLLAKSGDYTHNRILSAAQNRFRSPADASPERGDFLDHNPQASFSVRYSSSKPRLRKHSRKTFLGGQLLR